MKTILELLELTAVFLTTFFVIIGGGMGFFVTLGHLIR